ncbi:Uma2 family endonuclease [Streptomyces cyaneofuscatus]|uniref:Uma2 family endonuclease n=1 Tax=Streptomyces cyaneofuscatus TaxID=66883 RepID=UPI0033AE3BE3
MTPSTADHAPRAQMSVEEFEQLARTSPETVTLELINGKLEVKPVPDGDHDTLVVYSEPEKGRYRRRTTYGYGDTVPLPDPVDITLESEELKNYAR